MKQKFFRGQKIRLVNDFDITRSHFGGKGGEAIVEGSYADQCGLGNYSDFTLLVLSGKEDEYYPYSSSWYPEKDMTLISDDRAKGELAIQMYNEFMDENGDVKSDKIYKKRKNRLLKEINKLYSKTTNI